MKTSTTKIVSSAIVLGLLASACGGKGNGKSSASSPGAQDEHGTPVPGTVVSGPTDGSNIQGYYLANFITLNPHVNGTLPGSATFFRKEDRLFAYLRLFAGGPKAWHQQKVYTGTRCPTLADDTNTDGYIDITEAEAVVGKVLIPLDADPSTQNSGRNFYPVGDLSGSYQYERVVNFNRFMQDLRSEDKSPDDNMVKLGADEPLIIEGKVVMVQGTAETIEYPETVASTNRHLPHQTLPIACGIFKKADVTPGSPYDGTIPGPIADVEEGQDRPAPENEGTTTDVNGHTEHGTNEAETNTETRDEHGNVSRHTENSTESNRNTGGNSNTTNSDDSHTNSDSTDTNTNINHHSGPL